MKNKGFSLVELIIVIAIMAILAAAIAPALIRYIDKSRRSDDVAAAETLNTATQAAFANEDAYDEVQGAFPANATDTIVLASATEGGTFSMTATTHIINNGDTFLGEINSSNANKAPSFKYKKNSPTKWLVGANGAGKPVVWIQTTSKSIELQPSIDKSYK